MRWGQRCGTSTSRPSGRGSTSKAILGRGPTESPTASKPGLPASQTTTSAAVSTGMANGMTGPAATMVRAYARGRPRFSPRTTIRRAGTRIASTKWPPSAMHSAAVAQGRAHVFLGCQVKPIQPAQGSTSPSPSLATGSSRSATTETPRRRRASPSSGIPATQRTMAPACLTRARTTIFAGLRRSFSPASASAWIVASSMGRRRATTVRFTSILSSSTASPRRATSPTSAVVWTTGQKATRATAAARLSAPERPPRPASSPSTCTS